MPKHWILIAICVLWTNIAQAVEMGCHAPGYQLLRSVVRVTGDDGSRASGVVIAHNRIATAAHVVAASRTVYIEFGNAIYNAQLLRIDKERDLALLAAPTMDLWPIPVSSRLPIYWQPVWAVGYPLARDQVAEPGFFERYFNGGLQTTADVQSGQSGGALVSCEKGRHVVLGIIRGYGAYPDGKGGYDRLPGFSVSVAAADLSQFVGSEVELAYIN